MRRVRNYWTAAREQAEARVLNSGKAPNPRRITMALDLMDAQGPEVDIALGGVEPMVDEWESGARIPTRDQIERLAKYTGFGADFFYLADPAPLVGWVCTRSGKGRGCTRVDTTPPAPVTHLPRAGDQLELQLVKRGAQ